MSATIGVSDAVPSGVTLAIDETGRRLSLDPNHAAQPTDSWARFEALALDVVREPPRATNGHPGFERLKTRRLALRAATLTTDPALLQASLRACVPETSGFSDLRVWYGAGVPWIGGRLTIGHRQAPFTIRLALQPRATAGRRLVVFLGDVRLYAPLPLPAPLVGSALARAIARGCGRPPAQLSVRDGALDLAPLELMLVPALVASGWRLPDLSGATLREVAAPEDRGTGALRLLFDAGDPPAGESARAAGSTRMPCSWLEGEPLPGALATAERAMFAGDVRAAEEAYRAHLEAQPEERAAQARLVALAAPAGTAVLDAGARALTQAWPDFVPGWLYAALGAWQAGDREMAAAWFMRASALATARGEDEDARLAAEAAAAARYETPRSGDTAGGEPMSTFTQTAGDIARALIAGDHASADAGIAAHLQAADDPTRRGILHAEIAEEVLAAGGGEGLALATLAEVSLAGSSQRGLELRAELAERQGNASEAARALGELIARATAAGEGSRARMLAHRQARLTAPAGEPAIPRPIEASDPAGAGDGDGGEAAYEVEIDAPATEDPRARAALVLRRARLARSAGDHATAEACFGELAVLDPGHIEARQVLADLAIERGDRRTAAQRLEEVLRLLPLDALDATLAVRERLGELYAALGDWGAARYYQELILAQDAGRTAALDRLIEALLRLGFFDEAAAACERLSRLYVEPPRRAEALHRQGEILLERLHDEPRAFDAFLKSSDLAPTFVPTALRLVSGFWMRGRFAEVAEVAGDVARTGALGRAPLAVRVRASLAAALAGHETAPPTPASVDEARELPRELAGAMAEAALRLGAAPPSRLEPAITLITAPGGSDARAALAATAAALAAIVKDDPAAMGGGAALALGWLADRRAEPSLARPLYALATFLEAGTGVAARLDELGPCPPVTPATMALAGGNDHPGVGGTAAPLRRALGTLARGLAGFGPLATRPARAGALDISGHRREAWHALATVMNVPPLGLAVDDEVSAGATQTENDVTALATRPALVTIPRAMLAETDDELTFAVAYAFDRVRSGLALVDGGTSGEARQVEALLRGAAAALAGRTPPELPLAAEAAMALSSPEGLAALVGAAPRPRVAGDLLLAEEALVGWEGFRAAAALASDRFALLACRNPLAALRALYRRFAGDELSAEHARRGKFLRSPRLRELVAFLTSGDYADATRDAGRG